MKKLRIVPLGGLGEIGMNCLVLEWQDGFVLVDCGIQFPDANYPGVEILTPDFSYLSSRWAKFIGVVVTHGHDDHIGAIPFLSLYCDVDVYATPFPTSLIQQKLSEFPSKKPVRFHPIKPRKSFRIGPLSFDPIPVQHSIIEALAFAIQTPVGVIVHSGDFKHDDHPVRGERIGFGPFKEWSKQGVRLLLSDSTNAERAGHTLSEVDIEFSFKKFFADRTGRLFICLFASDVRRFENLLHLSKSSGKKSPSWGGVCIPRPD